MDFSKNAFIYLNIILFASMIWYKVPDVLNGITTIFLLIFHHVKDLVYIMLNTFQDVLFAKSWVLVFT